MNFCWHCWHINDNSIKKIMKKSFCRKQGEELDYYEFTETCCRCDKVKNSIENSRWTYPLFTVLHKEIANQIKGVKT